MSSETLGVVIATAQGVFCADPEDRFVTRALREHGEYGRGEIERISGFLNPNSRVLLVGAHIGALLVPLSKKVRSIVAIEANPATFRLLQLNMRLNDCDNVRLFNLAAGEAAGTIDFVVNRINSGASKRMPLVPNPEYFKEHPKIAQVPLARLDDLLPDETFDLVFMDIEGSELFAMRGMPRILASAQVVFAEFYPFMVRDVTGAGAAEFLEPLEGFGTLAIPSLRKVVHREGFQAALQDMFDNNQCDNGIVFLRGHRDLRFAG